MNKVDFIKLEDEIKDIMLNLDSNYNDMAIYKTYCLKRLADTKNLKYHMGMNEFILKALEDADFRKYFKLRSYDSVSRVRRRILEKNPELKKYNTRRIEEEYKDYAKC